jgi:predicted RNA-binding Zn ribbon-like protein
MSQLTLEALQMELWFSGLRLVGGHPAIDLVNTVEYRGRAEDLDRLQDFRSLVTFAATVGVLEERERRVLLDQSSQGGASTATAYAAAINMREDLRIVLAALSNRDAAFQNAAVRLSIQIENAIRHQQFRYYAAQGRWLRSLPILNPQDIVHRLSLEAEDVLTNNRRSIRECQGPDCDWLFIDRSRSGVRRWCHTAQCGNTVRVRRFRQAG